MAKLRLELTAQGSVLCTSHVTDRESGWTSWGPGLGEARWLGLGTGWEVPAVKAASGALVSAIFCQEDSSLGFLSEDPEI